jgi:hypothetical protein
MEFYKLNPHCPTQNWDCSVIQSSPSRVAWYTIPADSFKNNVSVYNQGTDYSWTSVYKNTFDSLLTITAFTRIPLNIKEPLKYYLALNLPIFSIGTVLERYFSSPLGYIFVFELDTLRLVATSLNFSDLLAPSGERYTIYNSPSEDLNMIGHFINRTGLLQSNFTKEETFEYEGSIVAVQPARYTDFNWCIVVIFFCPKPFYWSIFINASERV